MPNDGSNSGESFFDRVLDRFKPQPPPPEPQPPPVNQGAWDQSVEEYKLKNLTVHDVGLIVFNESRSFSERPDSNESIDSAREKMAHVVINGDEKYGSDRQKVAGTALPVEPSQQALKDPNTRAAYDSSMRAAREAFLSGSDPTGGATHLNQRVNSDRGNLKYPKGDPNGLPISTQSGPYNNSYTKGKVPSNEAWLNTYKEK
jgi:hypothetical protein